MGNPISVLSRKIQEHKEELRFLGNKEVIVVILAMITYLAWITLVIVGI